MNRKALVVASILIVCTLVVSGQKRTNYRLPDIPGYITLKGDFHMHTPFSDGSVWPADRVAEAWRDGLDVIAITDHVEYSPNKKDVSNDLNRPYELALPEAEKYGILLIRAAEITRGMPPGHFNAFFLNDANALRKDDFREAFKAAQDQGAFFLWNHPGWKAQQPDTTKWWPLHTEFLQKGWMQGIEVFNEKEYYPIVTQWAHEKKLSIFANTDVHGPIDFMYDATGTGRRPLTLVFAKDRTLESVREAFFKHRTAALFNDTLVGYAENIIPFAQACLKLQVDELEINARNEVDVVLINTSDFPLSLSGISNDTLGLPKLVKLGANSSERFGIKIHKLPATGASELTAHFKVNNVLAAPGQPITIALGFAAFSIPIPNLQRINETQWSASIPASKSPITYSMAIGSKPEASQQGRAIIFINQDSLLIQVAAFKQGKQLSNTRTFKLFPHKALNSKVTLVNEPAPKYRSMGGQSLVDGVKGTKSYSAGHWLGFEGKNPEVLIEMEKPTTIETVDLRFLESNHSWIFLPKEVKIFTSADGVQFVEFATVKNPLQTTDSNRGIVKYQFKKKCKQARFIKITANCFTECPTWHPGNGKPAWVFMDEVLIK